MPALSVRRNRMGFVLLTALPAALLMVGNATAVEPRTWRLTAEFSAPEAKQAAAADDARVLVVTNDHVAIYDRITQQRTARSKDAGLKHLNSAFLFDGRIYLAHSNFPTKPERSEIFQFDIEKLELTKFHDFGNFGGSLTWCVRDDVHWWCNFALYGADNRRTFLVRFDSAWRETGRWTYPSQVMERIGGASLSGGIWYGGGLLVSDHDHGRLYRLQVPSTSDGELVFVAEEPAPLTGQGFAVDPKTGGLVGIDRARKKVLFMETAP